MNDATVLRNLRSMGMTCFVEYFHEFADESLSRQDLIELLLQEEDYTEESCGSRATCARSIIRAGRAKVALNLNVEAGKVPNRIKDEARRLRDSLP